MKDAYWQVLLPLSLLLKLISGAATNQTDLTVDQKHLQIIEGSLGLNQTPCSNFYEYACGQWLHFKKAPGTDQIQVLDYRIRDEMSDIIQTFEHLNEPKFLQTVYSYYKSCQDLKDGDAQLYLKWMNSHENVSWPLVAEKPIENDWIELLALTRKYGYNEIFFHESVIQRNDDALTLAIEFKRPAVFGLYEFSAQIYGLRDKLDAGYIQQFGEFQKNLLKLTLELIRSEENGNLEFIQNTMTETSNIEPQLVTLRELEMPWLHRYLSIILEQPQVDPNMQIYVHSENYLRRIHEFLSKYDNRFLCDYIQIKFLKFLEDRDTVRKKGSCSQSVRHLFPLVMQWAYEKNHLELQWQTSLVRNIFENLKRKFRQTLVANSYHFNGEIQKYLLKKIDQLQLMVGNLSSDELEHYYEHLSLNDTDYYGNRLKAFNWHFKKAHGAIARRLKPNALELLHLRPYESGERLETILSLHNLPDLYPRLNAIFLPVTMIRSPFYEDGLLDVYTYSSMGFLLAHEIVKAFDLRHLQLDANGYANFSVYNEIQANREFNKSNELLRNELLEKDYNVEDVIDDLGALKLAYDTLAELHPKLFQKTITLGINRSEVMTMEKVFFLNYAQNFCNTFCHTSRIFYDLCDRVNKPVKYFNRFLKAFQCSTDHYQGKPMWH